MDKETRIAKGVYVAVTALLTTVMLVGGIYLQSIPESFFA